MAEGGEFGIDLPEVDDKIDHDDSNDVYVNDDDAEQEIDITHLFTPDAESTRSGEQIEMQIRQHEQSGLPEKSFDEDIPLLGGFVHQDDKPALLERAREFIKKRFPRVDFGKMDPIGFSKEPGNDTTIVSFGKKKETLIFRKDGKGLYKNFTDKFKKSLGPEAESLLAQDNEEIRENRQSLREAEKQLRDAEKLASEIEKATQEVQNLRNKYERVQAQIDEHTQEHGTTIESESELRRLQQLKKNLQTDFENAKKEVSALQKQAKTKDKEEVSNNLEQK